MLEYNLSLSENEHAFPDRDKLTYPNREEEDMLEVNMASTVRTVFGKGAMRRLRRDMKTPAVMYARGEKATSLQLETTELYKKLMYIHGRNAVITLEVDGGDTGRHHVLVQEVQIDPVADSLLHVDFLEIDLDKPIAFAVPLKFVGTAKGVDMGGDLHVLKKNIRLRGLPLEIPDYIETDISNLGRGEGLTFKDLHLPENVEMLDKAEATCVMVD